MKSVSNRSLVWAIVASMALWGLSWPSGKVLTHYCAPVNLAILRYIIVILTLFPFLAAIKTSFRVRTKSIAAIIASGALLAIYTWLFFQGLKFGAPGAGGVLVTTLNPVVAYAIGIVLSRRLPSPNESAGLISGLVAGVVLLKVWENAGAVLDPGNLYFLLAAITWAVMSKFTSQGALSGSALGFSLWQYVVTLACLLPLLNIHDLAQVLKIKDAIFWGNLIFSSAIVTTLATTVYFYSTTRLGAEKASSYIFMVPLAAALSACFLLGEKIQPHTAIGGALGILAVYLINRRKDVTPMQL